MAVKKVSKRLKPILSEFQEKLEGWMTDPDGEDHCPSCWLTLEVRLGRSQVYPSLLKAVLKDSCPTKKVAYVRKLADAFAVLCAGCGVTVKVPYA